MSIRPAVAVLITVLLAPLNAQERKPSVFSATSTLVQVDAVITDKDGNPVPDLTAADIELFEAGKRQEIAQVRYVTVAPAAPAPVEAVPRAEGPGPLTRLKRDQVRRTLALVVDDLGLSFESTAYVRASLKKFVDTQLEPGDMAAIVRTSAGMGALQQFTADRRLLEAAIDRVRYSMQSRVSGVFDVGPLGGDAAGTGTNDDDYARSLRLQEDVYATGTLGAVGFVVRALRELPGRKAIVLFSDGLPLYGLSLDDDNERAAERVRVLTDEANRAQVAIYTVDARGVPTLNFAAADNVAPEGVQDRNVTNNIRGKDGLALLAKDTGGVFLQDDNDLSKGVARALKDQSGYYLIGYSPAESSLAPGGAARQHQLSVKLKRPDLSVRLRRSFYEAEAKPEERPDTPGAVLARAVTSPFDSGEVGLRLTSLFDYGPKQGSVMRTLLHIDGNGLTYQKQDDGSSKAEIEILAVTYTDQGQAIDQVARGSAIQVKPDAEDAVRRSGFVYTVSVPVKKPGAYQLRTAVRDRFSGKVGSANQLIEVPDIKKGRLALSGILLTGAAATPVGADGEVVEGARIGPDPEATEAVRRFRLGTVASYGFVVYNAQGDKGKPPQVASQIRVFREGKMVLSGKPRPVDPGPQKDMKRLITGGTLRFGPEMEPGEYVLQVVVTDALAKAKERTTAQWIDFQLLK